MEIERRNQEPSLLQLDTVRALHQTVVSLRNALESSKAELQDLKDKYENKNLNEAVEQLSLENNLLKRKILDIEQYQQSRPNSVSGTYNVTIGEPNLKGDSKEKNCDSFLTCSFSQEETPLTVIEVETKPNYQKTIDLHSKFDVKIKVSTLDEKDVCNFDVETSSQNGNVDRNNISCKHKIGPIKENYKFEVESVDKNIHIESSSLENLSMAMPDVNQNDGDKLNIKVKISSEENLVVINSGEKSTEPEDVEEESVRSEFDNSVFSNDDQVKSDVPFEQESGNESEEVDDIELIFTTDETKDMSNLQEDLVSICDGDWSPLPNTSTPVLIKFKTLDGECQSDRKHRDNLASDTRSFARDSTKIKRTSLPDVKKVSLNIESGFREHENKSDNTLNKKLKYKSLDSTESLGVSFDNQKSSSFEIGSSVDTLQRDESVDNFSQMRNFNEKTLMPQSDLTQCGLSQENLAAKLNSRRFTSPNALMIKQPTIVVPQCVNRVRDSSTQTRNYGPPPRWTSDGSLAHKICVGPHLTTLPSKVYAPHDRSRNSGKTARGDQRHHTDESRRLLLSDIGFTSLVPELSRSAEPVWAIQESNSKLTALRSTRQPHFGASSRASFIHSPPISFDFYDANTTPHMAFCGSLPELRKPKVSSRFVCGGVALGNNDVCDGEHTPRLIKAASQYLRRSLDNIWSRETSEEDIESMSRSRPYIPTEPRQIKLGHIAKVIAPHGQIVVGKIRYIGVVADKPETHIGITSPSLVGCERAKTLCQSDRALLVPFHKLVMAWET